MKRSFGLAAVVAIVASVLAACASTNQSAGLQPGSSLAIGESGPLIAVNSAVLAGPNSAQTAYDLAQLTLPAFYSHDANGALVANTEFGTVTRDDSNNVTYTLAGKAKWQDGQVVSPADLAVSWMAATDSKVYTLADGVSTRVGFGSSLRLTALALADKITILANGVKLHFSAPVPNWQTVLPLTVPAHLLGQLALPNAGLSPADAEKKVLDLVTGVTLTHHSEIADAFANAFTLPTDGSALDKAKLFSAGAYRILSATSNKITLTAVPSYAFGPQASVQNLTVNAYASPDDLANAVSAKAIDLSTPVASTATNLAQLQGKAKDAGLTTSVGDSGKEEVALLNYGAGSAFNASTWGGDATKVKAAREGFFKFLPRAGIWSELAGDSSIKKTDSLVFDVGSGDYQTSVERNGSANYQFQDAEASAEAWQAAKFDRTLKIRVVFDANSARGQLEYSQLARLGKLGGFDVENDSSDNPAAVLAGGQWDVYLTEQGRLADDVDALATTVGALTGFQNPAVGSIVSKVASGQNLSKSSAEAKNLDQLLIQNYYGLPIFQLERLTVWSSKLRNYSPNSTNQSVVWGYSNWSVSGKGK